MRTTIWARLLALALVSTALAAPPADVGGRVEVAEAALDLAPKPEEKPEAADSADTTDGGSDTGTVFNGQKVPPMTEISGDKIDATIGKGYW